MEVIIRYIDVSYIVTSCVKCTIHYLSRCDTAFK